MVAAGQQNGISGTPRHAGLESGGTSCSSIRCVYDVLEDGAVVRRIFLSPVAPADKPWMWASGRNRQIRPTATSRRARRRWRRSPRAGCGNSPALPLARLLARFQGTRHARCGLFYGHLADTALGSDSIWSPGRSLLSRKILILRDFGGRARTRTGTPESRDADFKSAVSTVPPRGLGASASSTAGARTSGSPDVRSL